MVQVALLLLFCSLSQYMWLVNTSVTWVVVFFPILGFLCYIGIVVAGISSYGCPFQTPASIALRCLRDSKTAWKWPPPTNIASHQECWLETVQERCFEEPPQQRPPVPQNVLGLQVHVLNPEGIRRQNTNDASCVCLALQSITEPNAIKLAIGVARTIWWFDGDSNHNPQFDVIISTFNACFDSTKQLYPGMRDQAYFLAQAILQINMRVRVRSQDRASKYPIPEVSTNSFKLSDPNLLHPIWMLEHNWNASRPTLCFPNGETNTSNYLLWLLNLFVDLTRVGKNLILQSYRSYLTIAGSNHRGTITNILLMWYIFLGGHIEETV